jgi:hypothetical protein
VASVTERMREIVEAKVETWIAPYLEMRDNAVELVTYQGKILARVPDLAARVKACELVLNRIEGMPHDGGPPRYAGSCERARRRGALNPFVRLKSE